MAGTWQPLANPARFNASTMLLLTNGTVMCQEYGSVNWWRLSPNSLGDYVGGGTWSRLAPMEQARLFYASAVLADGRVLVAGGEYDSAASGAAPAELLSAEIYDPGRDSWSRLPVPDGWTMIGDAPLCVLEDGRVLLGSIADHRTTLFDPRSGRWTEAGRRAGGRVKDDPSSEETWTLLPDDSVLTVVCTPPPNQPRKAQRYIPSADQWVVEPSPPVDLIQPSSSEIGPAVLLPDGSLFVVGATGRTALYRVGANPPWTVGPDFPPYSGPDPMQAKDAPACLLPNGRVLCAVGPAGEGEDYPGPTCFFEFDPTAAATPLTLLLPPVNGFGPPFAGRMLLIPTGDVLFTNGTANVQVYSSDGAPDPAWRPVIDSPPAAITRNQVFTLRGRQFNGLSQAVAYGDDATMATNYPIVRLAGANGTVSYCATFNHNTMGVATGSKPCSTSVFVPAQLSAGPAQMVVVANGIESAPVNVTVL